MSLTVNFHKLIQHYNILEKPTKQLDEYLRAHPNLRKATLITNHVFRAALTGALTKFLPYSMPVKAGMCLAGSLFYRLTVEVNCAYKFALPAFGGAFAFRIGNAGLSHLISGVAFSSIKAFSDACVSLTPLCGYFAYIALTVSYDVDH